MKGRTMGDDGEIRLITVGVLAESLGVPLARVLYILRTRPIRSAARAGTVRLFDKAAVAEVRAALDAMDARRGARK